MNVLKAQREGLNLELPYSTQKKLKDSENIIQIYKNNWPIKIFHLKSVTFLVQHVQHFKTETPEF